MIKENELKLLCCRKSKKKKKMLKLLSKLEDDQLVDEDHTVDMESLVRAEIDEKGNKLCKSP